MDIAGIGGLDRPSQAAKTPRTRHDFPGNEHKLQGEPASSAAPKGNGGRAVDEFMDYMKTPPAQRMLNAWLSRHGISREEFDAMTPEEKQKIMDEMKREMEAKLKQKPDTASSTSTDIFA